MACMIWVKVLLRTPARILFSFFYLTMCGGCLDVHPSCMALQATALDQPLMLTVTWCPLEQTLQNLNTPFWCRGLEFVLQFDCLQLVVHIMTLIL